LADDPLWYKDAIIYETHVRAFHDSDDDGIGDFRGLTAKLSYLEALGVNTIWLLPFYPSPLKDDGYDIADYTGVHPSYGTIQDFTRFLREAHRRGLRVITELVINHTSDQHPWFRRARRAPAGSPDRNFYVWSDTPSKYRRARIIFKDFEPSNWSVDPVAKAYYWHRFYAHQPDLNFDNPEVHKALTQVVDFWMRRGVDGLRLDAVPYLYEREGTSCENLPETHAYLKQLRRYIDQHYRNRMLLAEANQWPDDAAAYFGAGDECHMNFHFPIMPRMFMAIRMEDRYPLVDILAQTPAVPDNCQWATFLRNHDELTLEMVTDRERDYMYQAYARDRQMRINLGIRRRLAPLLGNDRRAIELMNGLLFSLPGSPIIYYGDEIGMGDNVYLGDRNGVRTPMQWSADRNAGFSRTNPQRLYLPVIIDPQYHYESVNVESQENTPQSLLWWMRRLIGLRKRFAAFGRGSLEILHSTNHKVLSFLRVHGDQRVLVVANLSRFAQHVELDLARFRGMVPVEAFGQTRFRPVGDERYYLTLGPYAFYWFALETPQADLIPWTVRPRGVQFAVAGSWENVLEGRARTMLERSLPSYLGSLPRMTDGERRIEAVTILDSIRVVHRAQTIHWLVVQIEYSDGTLETDEVPLAFAASDPAQPAGEWLAKALIAHVKIAGKDEGVLYDALWDPQMSATWLQMIVRRRRAAGRQMELVASLSGRRPDILPVPEEHFSSAMLHADRRRVITAFGDRLLLKMYRKLEAAMNPDLEVGRFLTRHGFAHAPATIGAMEIRRTGQEPMTVAILRQFIPHEKSAWQYTLDALGQYFERALAHAGEQAGLPLPPDDWLRSTEHDAPVAHREAFGFYWDQAALLGRRTAEFHRALASDPDDPAFAPEAFTPFYQRAQYQALRGLLARVLQNLRERLEQLPEGVRGDAQAVLDMEPALHERFAVIRDHKFDGFRIRCHGNYHLAQILYTGKDFVITDFQGDPRQTLSERRGKYSALHDVACMIRSFHYAAYVGMQAEVKGTLPAGTANLAPWYRYWQAWIPTSFLRGYLEAARDATFLPTARDELNNLLEINLLSQTLIELQQELGRQGELLHLPLEAILQQFRAPVRT
jgi:maltose alpha-D-glucosyltransferase/alpha-amylase